MIAPEHLLYTRDHEWVELDREANTARMGITDFAQDALGEVVFVQAPEVGTQVQVGITFGEVESSKSVSDVYSPLTGTVAEVNSDLSEFPQRMNEDPYGRGWFCVLRLDSNVETEHLLNAESYRELVEP